MADDPKADRMAFSPDALRTLRVSNGLSVSDLASIVGVRDRTIERWQRDEMTPCVSTRLRLERVLARLAKGFAE